MMVKRATKKVTKKIDKTTPPVTQDVAPSLCPRCRSPRRGDYHRVKTMTWGTKTVSWKRTECLDCGQRRIDRFVTETP